MQLGVPDRNRNPLFLPLRPCFSGRAEGRRWPSDSMTQRVNVPNNSVLGLRVILILVQVLGKYMILRDLDPKP